MKDDIYDALRDTVRALGGCSAAGKRMRPEMQADKAERWLADAINPGRAQKLSPEQVLLLAKWGRQAGCHTLIEFICADAGYEDPKPAILTEQLARLQQTAIDAQRKAAEASDDLRTMLDNPRLVALMQHAHVNTEGMG